MKLLLSLGLFFALLPRPACAAPLRYFPIGDSYTIGQSIMLRDNFPNQLARALGQGRQKVVVVDNLAKTGWTSQQAIDQELPAFEKAKPDFATLCIGVNDWVQGVPLARFRLNLQTLLDRMQAALPKGRHIVVLTVPDFSAAHPGPGQVDGRDVSAGIAALNVVIKEEAAARKLACVDLYPLSQEAKGKRDLFASDGLHPSAKQYAQWVQAMLPAASASLPPPSPRKALPPPK